MMLLGPEAKMIFDLELIVTGLKIKSTEVDIGECSTQYKARSNTVRDL